MAKRKWKQHDGVELTSTDSFEKTMEDAMTLVSGLQANAKVDEGYYINTINPFERAVGMVMSNELIAENPGLEQKIEIFNGKKLDANLDRIEGKIDEHIANHPSSGAGNVVEELEDSGIVLIAQDTYTDYNPIDDPETKDFKVSLHDSMSQWQYKDIITNIRFDENYSLSGISSKSSLVSISLLRSGAAGMMPWDDDSKQLKITNMNYENFNHTIHVVITKDGVEMKAKVKVSRAINRVIGKNFGKLEDSNDKQYITDMGFDKIYTLARANIKLDISEKIDFMSIERAEDYDTGTLWYKWLNFEIISVSDEVIKYRVFGTLSAGNQKGLPIKFNIKPDALGNFETGRAWISIEKL
jgi:hypothetical protein